MHNYSLLYICIPCLQSACKHAPLNTNNEIQDNAKESYYIHNKTHITLNAHTIRKLFQKVLIYCKYFRHILKLLVYLNALMVTR
jgi:hypothetical protein